MKEPLDWQSREVVSIYDEVSLWSAPFGRVLLEHIPMRYNGTVVDIGFGTGFPLVELAQRFGESTQIIGVDIWPEAIRRTKEKVALLELQNVQIIEQPASELSLKEDSIDLVCSNLGINNFEEREVVYQKVHDMLTGDGHFCLTTNDDSTFHELYEVFRSALTQLEQDLDPLERHVSARSTEEDIIREISSFNFKQVKTIRDETRMRFIDAEAVFDHSLIRIGFIGSWKKLVNPDLVEPFFSKVKGSLTEIIKKQGEFSMTIPILYLEFQKINSG